MVSVRLERDWTDGAGGTHAAGAMVDVDVSTLARLEARGLVADPGGTDSHHDWSGLIASRAGHRGGGRDRSPGWPGLSSGDPGRGTDGGGDPGGDDPGGGGDPGGGDGDSWVEPTGGDQDADSWVEPTGGGDE